MPKSRNSGLNPEESFPRQRNETLATVARQRLGEPLSATVNPGYRGIAGVSDTAQIWNRIMKLLESVSSIAAA
jgi:hypothetical protein